MSPPGGCLCFGAVLAHNNDKVVHHGFSSFFVIHRKRESAVFSGERNAPARCLPAYNRCSRLTCTQHGETWLSLATSPAIGCGGPPLRPRRAPIGQGRIESARSDSHRACHCRVTLVRNRKSARDVSCTVAQQINIACRRNSQ